MHTIYLKERLVASIVNLAGDRHTLYFDSTQVLQLGRYYYSLQKGLEVVDEPDLAGLADAFAVRESLPTEQARRVVNVVVEPEVQDQANRSGSGSTLA